MSDEEELLAPLDSRPRRPKRLVRPVSQCSRQLHSHAEVYLSAKEQRATECCPKSLFKSLAAAALRTKLRTVKKLPTGRGAGAGKEFETLRSVM
jgi:hypothetical protein